MNRKKTAIINSIVNVGTQMLTFVLSFVLRKLFIIYIGIDYLGINTVLAEGLGMLAITELGFQNVIVFQLYKPLSNGDTEKVSEIITLLKRVYRVVGITILILGLAMLPFLRVIVKNVKVPMSTVYIAYILLLVGSVVTYFCAFKRTLLYADQKQYITSIVDSIVNLGCSLLRLLAIILLKSFYVYTAITIVQNILSNYIIHLRCKKYYPELRTNVKVNGELKGILFQDTKNVLFGKIAGYIYSSTDNLVISAVLGTGLVGYFGNYTSITKAITRLISYCFGAMQPLIGNYVASESKEASYSFFKQYTFLRYYIASVVLVPAFCLINRVIEIWLGKEFILENIIPLLLVIDIYVACVQGAAGEFVSALGYFRYEKYISIIGAVCNLFISVVASYCVGIKGVLIGTVVSQFVMWFGRSFILYKFYFEDGLKKYGIYWGKQLIYVIILIGECVLSKILLGTFQAEASLLLLMIQGILVVILCILVHTLVFCKTREFKYFWQWVLGILSKRRRF